MVVERACFLLHLRPELVEEYLRVHEDVWPEVLDGLRRTGRVIGVVSHVSEMKQRIDTQLVVTKTPGGSHLSVVAGPWDAA